MPDDTTIERKRQLEEVVLMWLSAGTAAGVLPFVFIRIFQADWVIAVFNSVIVTVMIGLFFYVSKTGKTRAAALIISFFLVVGVLTTVIIKGSGQFVWAYPASVSIYYLIKHKMAAVINLIAILILAVMTFSEMELVSFASSLVTLVATNVFAYIFASRTCDQHQQLIDQATQDPLTKVGNRRSFELKIKRQVNIQQRTQHPTSMITIDLDHFKRVNDTYGHAKGDEVLINTTKVLTMRLRGIDNLYRIGGEEFVIMPIHSNLKSAEILAEQLRVLVEASELTPDIPVTISLGVAQYKQDETVSEWLHRADTALYQAKNEGRNRTRVAK